MNDKLPLLPAATLLNEFLRAVRYSMNTTLRWLPSHCLLPGALVLNTRTHATLHTLRTHTHCAHCTHTTHLPHTHTLHTRTHHTNTYRALLNTTCIDAYAGSEQTPADVPLRASRLPPRRPRCSPLRGNTRLLRLLRNTTAAARIRAATRAIALRAFCYYCCRCRVAATRAGRGCSYVCSVAIVGVIGLLRLWGVDDGLSCIVDCLLRTLLFTHCRTLVVRHARRSWRAFREGIAACLAAGGSQLHTTGVAAYTHTIPQFHGATGVQHQRAATHLPPPRARWCWHGV